MNALWLIPALLLYALAAAGFILDRIGSRGRLAEAATWMLAAGAATQTVYLAAAAIQIGNVPVINFAQSLCFLAWLTALAALGLIVRYRMSVVGAIVTPIIFLAIAVAATMSHIGRIVMPQSLRSAWLPIHVTLAFLGYALFVLAAGVSAVYLVFERRLKAKRPFDTSDDHAPSLEKLDRINYHLLGWGFLMLSLAITSGAIWADATWGHFWSWEPQESWSLAIWLLYAALLESRLTVGWRGRRAAALTIVVFTVLVGSFISVNLVTPGKHGGSFG
jgi:cytochrome c-type biogenesis protein CcsB